MSCAAAAGSGKISLESLLCEDDISPPCPMPWEPPAPGGLRPLPPSLLEPGRATISDELWRQLPKNAAFQDPLEDVVLSLAELVVSSLTTFRGFSNALRMYLASGRFIGLGLRHVFATIAIAHTSSNRSSSSMRDGSTIFITNSFSYAFIYGSTSSNHSFVLASLDPLMPSLPVTSSSNTFPKQ